MELVKCAKPLVTKKFGSIGIPHRMVSDVHILDVDMLAVSGNNRIIWIDEAEFMSVVNETDAVIVQMPDSRTDYPIFEINLTKTIGLMANMRIVAGSLFGDLHFYNNDLGDMYYKLYADGMQFNYKPYCHSSNLANAVDGMDKTIKVDTIGFLTPINPVSKTFLHPIFID